MLRRCLLPVLGASLLAACTYDFEGAFSGGGEGGSGGVGGTTSGTTSGTETGTSTGTGTGSGTSSGMPGSEDCFNSVDDDGDDLVDCEDEDCVDGTCQPVPPAGWEPVAFALVSSATTLPECTSHWPQSQDRVASLDAPPASCSPCSCGAVSYSCPTPTFTSYTSPNCLANSVEETEPLMDGFCHSISPNDFDAFAVPAPVVTASCPESGGQANVPPASWDEQGRLCAGASFGAGCGGDLCVPSSNDFAVCIVQEGDFDCPAGYPDKTVIHAGQVMDTRGCSSCTCAPNVQCTGTTEVFVGNQFCGGGADFVHVNDGSCVTVGRGDAAVSMTYDQIETVNPCTVGGGAPTGEATPTNPRTVCCLP